MRGNIARACEWLGSPDVSRRRGAFRDHPVHRADGDPDASSDLARDPHNRRWRQRQRAAFRRRRRLCRTVWAAVGALRHGGYDLTG